MLSYVQCINAEDIPEEFYEDETDRFKQLTSVCDDGSPFSEWLKSIGFKFDEKRRFTWIGVFY